MVMVRRRLDGLSRRRPATEIGSQHGVRASYIARARFLTREGLVVLGSAPSQLWSAGSSARLVARGRKRARVSEGGKRPRAISSSSSRSGGAGAPHVRALAAARDTASRLLVQNRQPKKDDLQARSSQQGSAGPAGVWTASEDDESSGAGTRLSGGPTTLPRQQTRPARHRKPAHPPLKRGDRRPALLPSLDPHLPAFPLKHLPRTAHSLAMPLPSHFTLKSVLEALLCPLPLASPSCPADRQLLPFFPPSLSSSLPAPAPRSPPLASEPGRLVSRVVCLSRD